MFENFWLRLPARAKENEATRFNYIMKRVVSLQEEVKELQEEVKELKDRVGYNVIVFESNGLTGATVKLDDTACTDNNDGSYSLSNVKPDEYTLSATLDGYEEYSETITVSEDSSFNFTLTPLTYDAVFVVADSEEAPVEEATITIGEDTKTTDSEGKATFTGLLADTYDYEVSKEGYVTQTSSITISDEDVTENITLVEEE